MASPRIEARVSEDIFAFLLDRAKKLNVSMGDVLRDILHRFFYEKPMLEGPDAGFQIALNLAPKLARAALLAGLKELPDEMDEASEWAEHVIREYPIALAYQHANKTE